jgi:endonuclease/exonuclease/phosphatase family metal-dependent hydrolase
MRRLVLPFACVPLLSSAACDFGPVGLGGDETDGFLVAGAAETAHLGAAIEGGDALTFGALFEKGDGLVFAGAPDPSALLTANNVVDDDRPRAGRQPLSLLTYNVGLLDVNIFGVVPYAETPHLERRREVLPGLIFARGADVVVLQEVWLDEDVAEFRRTAADFGYRAFLQDRAGHNDGLMSFVREAVLLPGADIEFDYAPYGVQNGTEYFPGPGIQRGWNSFRFVHRDLGGIRVFNTHMQAFPEQWLNRAKQARELGIAMRTAANPGDDTANDLVFVGGDFNSGPYYRDAIWRTPTDGDQTQWFHNAISYPLLLAYGGLVDLAIMGRPAADALADVVLGNTVVNDPAAALATPGAEAGWCERTPPTTFTGTDCNSLYFQQYAGTEYPARLDHWMARDPAGRVVVTNSTLAFTEKLRFGDTEVEPSDHYGVLVELVVAP